MIFYVEGCRKMGYYFEISLRRSKEKSRDMIKLPLCILFHLCVNFFSILN